MAIEILATKRTFTFNGVNLPDVEGMTPEEVKEIYTPQYPDLLTAVVEGPVIGNDDVETYTFVRNVGTKG